MMNFWRVLFIVKIDSRSTGTVDAGLTQCFFCKDGNVLLGYQVIGYGGLSL